MIIFILIALGFFVIKGRAATPAASSTSALGSALTTAGTTALTGVATSAAGTLGKDITGIFSSPSSSSAPAANVGTDQAPYQDSYNTDDGDDEG